MKPLRAKITKIHRHAWLWEPLEAETGCVLRTMRAREFFQAQPAWYRRQVTPAIVSAKKEETRQRRLEKTIAASARGERLR